MVKIITDTTSCLPAEFARQHDIPVIPQVIIFGNESYLEGVDIDHAGFMQRLKSSPELPKTAAPPLELFAKEFARLIPSGEPILCIHPSAELSGTVRSAVVAARDFPQADIRVIDTRVVAGPLAVMVQLAAEWAEAGCDANTIESRLNELSPRCRIYFLVATMEYLAKGGRISGATALLGTLLSIKPILALQAGRVEPFERERTQRRATARLVELVLEQIPRDGQGHLTVMHAAVPDEARALAAQLGSQLGLNRKKHPFYLHSTAEFLVVESERETLGRIAVMENRNYNRSRNTQMAFFYYMDVVNDAQVAEALFGAACDWARGQGLTQLIGPKGFMQGDGLGLLVEGFEHRPAVGIPYNYPYYDALLKGVGFEKETDYLSGHLSSKHKLDQRFFDVAEKVKARRGLAIKSFSSEKELRSWIPRIVKVYNASFTDNWEFCPVTDEESKIIGERLIAIADPRLIKLVLKGEEVIGFVFAFNDISAAIQKTKGRVWPFGWIALLREFKRTTWVNCSGTGLVPEHRGVGANAVLYTELAKSMRDFRFRDADVVQAEERNLKSLGDMAAIGVRWYKRHRVYRRAV